MRIDTQPAVAETERSGDTCVRVPGTSSSSEDLEAVSASPLAIGLEPFSCSDFRHVQLSQLSSEPQKFLPQPAPAV